MTRTAHIAPGHTISVDHGRLVVHCDDERSLLRHALERDARVAPDAGSPGRFVVSVHGEVRARLSDEKTWSVPLTAFEARALCDRHPLPRIPLDAPLPLAPRTDLHTHFAAALPGRALVDLGAAHGVVYPRHLLHRAGIVAARDTGVHELEPRARAALARALDLPIDEQVWFLEMERRYELRRPLTKDPRLLVAQLHAVAEQLASSGVRYAELSVSECLYDSMLPALHEHLDDVEARTGTRLRFLLALRRDDDVEWDLDLLDRLRACERSRAVVGIDIMGHETSATRSFMRVLQEAAHVASARDALVVRVHAGENPAYPENVREAVEALRAASNVELRIGHGLYGVDDALLRAMAAEPERILVEFNLTSNLALNNIQGAAQVPLQRMLDAGVSVVLGTDGAGLYATSARDEVRAALACGVRPDALARIAAVEDGLLARKEEREAARPPLRAWAPPPQAPHVHWNSGIRARKEAEAAAAREALIAACCSRGGRVLGPLERPETRGRPALWIAGAWRKAIRAFSADELARAEHWLDTWMRALRVRDGIVVTGGTRFGIEGVAHAHAAAHGVPMIGAIVDDLDADAADVRVQTFWRVAPDFWRKTSPLVRWMRDMDGFGAFMGGGLVVADEQQAACNFGIRHAVARPFPGPANDAARASSHTRFIDEPDALWPLFDARGARSALRHEGPNDAVDIVLIRRAAEADGEDELLVVERHDRSGALAGRVALPGGFVETCEDARDAACRVLRREAGLQVEPHALRRVCVVEGPGRDPRDTATRWVRTTVFVGRTAHRGPIVAGAGAFRARFVAAGARPPLAFDHDVLVERALNPSSA